MKVALVDNGSLAPAAHAALRAAAAAIAAGAGSAVAAVSWKHSNRIDPRQLAGGAALTLGPWVRAHVATGEREFLFVPYFISPQGAIGTSLRRDLETLQAETGGFEFSFADGLSVPTLARIVADQATATMAARGLRQAEVIVVDHGGPSERSAAVRDAVADAVAPLVSPSLVTAASMETPDGPGFAFNRPLLADVLAGADGPVVIAPLFLSPGRHAGPDGDLARIARAAAPGRACHFAPLVGAHRLAAEALTGALVRALGVTSPS